MQYTQVPVNTFETLQMNAGILVDAFNPATGVVGNILGATTGGISFNSNPTFEDFGEDIDNVPNNTMQLKRIVSYDPTLSGTFLTVDPDVVATMIGGADVASTKITPRSHLLETDFKDVWLVADYSDKNIGASNAGYVAIHVMNALDTAGFQIQTTKNGKGQFAFEYHGHYDINDIDIVPFEVYVKAGGSSPTPSISLSSHAFRMVNGTTQALHATVVPAGTTVNWTTGNSSVATVSDGTVSAAGTGNTIITASITSGGVTYNDTCTVVVTAS